MFARAFALVIAICAVAVNAAAIDTTNGTRPTSGLCGSHLSDEAFHKMEAEFKELTQDYKESNVSAAAAIYTVNVHWHALNYGNTVSQGYIPTSQVTNAIKVLNQDFAGTGLQFRLARFDRYKSTWFNTAGLNADGTVNAAQTAMKNKLKTGTRATDLDIYTVSFRDIPYYGLLGYAFYPSSYSSWPKEDGVVLHYATVPGGTYTPYNQGGTLTHEVGHWVGLIHTFQGGCSAPGDSVSDTPPEASAAFGCPTSPRRDTCPGGGYDPIHNHMDYTTDACRTEFTKGQITRFKQQIRVYRGIVI